MVEDINLRLLTNIHNRIGPWDLTLNKKNQLLILNSYDESLMILDLTYNKVISTTKLGRSPICLRVFNSKIYILNCDSNSLSILDEETLTQLEEIYLEEKPSDFQIDCANFIGYIANTNGNSISILNLNNHTMEVKSINSQPFRILIKDNCVYILSYINNGITNYSCISALSMDNLQVKEYKIKGIFIDFVMLDDSTFLLTNPEDGYLYEFSRDNNKLIRKLLLGGMPGKIIKDLEMLYIIDILNNEVLIIDLKENIILEKIRVGKEPQGFLLL